MRGLATLVLALAGTAAALSCNGYAELCDRQYSNVTFIGAHNSPFVGVLPTQNQLTDVTSQLDSGVRFFTAQTHTLNGAIELCHTECILEDAGTLSTYLGSIKSWLDANPDEVVTLLVTNGDSIAISQFGDVFAAAGLDTYAYSPGSQLAIGDWPTLGTLVSNNTRLVILMDYGADTSQVSYILDEFAYFFETPFDPLEDEFSSCNIDRPSGASATGRLYLVNHNLNLDVLGILIPDLAEAETTNSLSSLLAHADVCISDYQRNPNVLLIDYTSIGDGIAAQNTLNGV